MIELVATQHHEHYDDATGVRLRVRHAPGDRFTLRDGIGMTAAQLAANLIAQGVAKPADKPKSKATK